MNEPTFALPMDLHGDLLEHLVDCVRRNEEDAAALMRLADVCPDAEYRALERMAKAQSADALIDLLKKY